MYIYGLYIHVQDLGPANSALQRGVHPLCVALCLDDASEEAVSHNSTCYNNGNNQRIDEAAC